MKGVKLFMDIEASLKALENNPKASLDEFDALYLDMVDSLAATPAILNDKIKILKSICLARAIDHSKYKYRGPPITAPKKRFTEGLGEIGGPPTSSAHLIKTSLNVRAHVQTCHEKAPFLSFCFIRRNSENHDAIEKFRVLFSSPITSEWVYKAFHPDISGLIDDFNEKELDGKYSWVILFLFHSNDHGVIDKLKTLLSLRPELLILDLNDLENGEENCWKIDKNKLFNGTISCKPSLLVHDVLDIEQECLIKDFFGENAGFLICTDLKGGLSGSRVVLVTPNIGPGDSRKYIVKLCNKSKSKLKAELLNFQNYVEPFWVPEQFLVAEFKESPRYQAIRYPFASKDTIHYSTSFTERYREIDSLETLQRIIDNIFSHSLCQKWRGQCRVNKRKFSEAFAPILNYVDSTKALDEVLSPLFSSSVSFDRTQLTQLLDVELNFLECPNHGDLHSDNIQIQEESHDVFLIDFGFTGKYPVGLDYAALEASIKFRLLDSSIDPKILFPFDDDPLGKYDNIIRLGEPVKGEADKAQKLTSKIRERYLNDFSGIDKNISVMDLKIQYLCCLLILCLRQIKYRNLNRRYILQILSQILPVLHKELIG